MLTRIAAAALGLLVGFATGTAAFLGYAWVATGGSYTGPSQGPNALWARHAWVGERHTEMQYVTLARLFRAHGITDVFFHAGPLDRAGRVAPGKYANAPALIDALARQAPEVRPQAWLGQVEAGGGGPLDLSRDAVRSAVVETARGFLAMGFRGIHYDIEPVRPGNDDFLDLLRRTREVTEARGAVLSVAAEDLDPAGRAGRLARAAFRRYRPWTPSYYRAVAGHADQIAVMSYDTALPLSWLYSRLVAWETKSLLGILPRRTTLFIGAPIFDDPSLGHHPRAETLVNAVLGLRRGLSSPDREAVRRVGVAIFAEWTTDDREWAELYRRWVTDQEHPRARAARAAFGAANSLG